MYFSNYPVFYDQWALSPQSVSAIYISSYRPWQEIENFLMQIISHHKTDGNQFLNRGISFSLTQTNLWEYICDATTEFTHFAFSQDSCKSTHQLIVRFSSLNPGLSNIGKYRNTLINIMYAQSLIVLQTHQIACLF